MSATKYDREKASRSTSEGEKRTFQRTKEAATSKRKQTPARFQTPRPKRKKSSSMGGSQDLWALFIGPPYGVILR